MSEWLRETVDHLTAELAECGEQRRALLKACKAALVGAKHESCKYRSKLDASPDPTWHCCDWSEVVEMLEFAIQRAEGSG